MHITSQANIHTIRQSNTHTLLNLILSLNIRAHTDIHTHTQCTMSVLPSCSLYMGFYMATFILTGSALRKQESIAITDERMLYVARTIYTSFSIDLEEVLLKAL